MASATTVFAVDGAPRVVFGPGSVGRVPDEVAALGLERVLIVASRANHGVARDLQAALGQRSAGSFGDVEQHVPEVLAQAARDAAAQLAVDGVLTVGGGSATGLGKAVALDLDVAVVAVPTTYSGSEMTPIYGITGEQGKRTGREPRVQPRVVVYDPKLTLGLPPGVTVTSGFNALAHGVEALYAPGANQFSSLLAVEAVKTLGASLPAAVETPRDLDARTEALYGAFLAGCALAGAGTALHHKLCHVLGGSYRLAHGDVNAVVLPHVVAFNQFAAHAALRPLATVLGSDDVAAWLAELARRLAAPPSLEALGLPADSLDDVVTRTIEAVGDANPRPLDPASLRELLADAYAGEPPRSWADGSLPSRPASGSVARDSEPTTGKGAWA